MGARLWRSVRNRRKAAAGLASWGFPELTQNSLPLPATRIQDRNIISRRGGRYLLIGPEGRGGSVSPSEGQGRRSPFAVTLRRRKNTIAAACSRDEPIIWQLVMEGYSFTCCRKRLSNFAKLISLRSVQTEICHVVCRPHVTAAHKRGAFEGFALESEIVHGAASALPAPNA